MNMITTKVPRTPECRNDSGGPNLGHVTCAGKKQNTHFKKPRNQSLLLIAIGLCFIVGTTVAMDDSAVVLERTKEEFRAIINEHLGQIKLGTETDLGNRFSVWKQHKNSAVTTAVKPKVLQYFVEQILGKLTKEYIKNLTPALNHNRCDPIEVPREFWEGKSGLDVHGWNSGKALFEFDLGRLFPAKWDYPDLSLANNPSGEDRRRRLMEEIDAAKRNHAARC